eukprot:4828017-Pleurochrysis_carterae.AAC.1
MSAQTRARTHSRSAVRAWASEEQALRLEHRHRLRAYKLKQSVRSRSHVYRLCRSICPRRKQSLSA